MRCLVAAARRRGLALRGRPDGLLATAGDSGTRIWEPVTGTVTLAEVSADTAKGVDLLDVAADAAALADVIAAKSTYPPLSIGLFADWGSGKSFLIQMIKERVRQLSRRAQLLPDCAAHHAHVRNVEFNAWHFADANLWASLATHILDELARAEDDGVPDATAAAQLARLEEQLASASSLNERLQRAQQHTERTAARRKLAVLDLGLGRRRVTGDDAQDRRGDPQPPEAARCPNWRAALKLLVVSLIVALVAGGAILAVGVDELTGLLTGAGALIATWSAWLATGAAKLNALLKQAGPATAVGEVQDANVKEDAKAAKAREQELRKELADLSTGRRLARFAGERGATGDYRSQLGVVSRIHDDFHRMSDILARQGAAAGGEDDEVPRIDRIVLYIDDLDRCQPKRVVEVLEAVHLILALPLFVVVLAVDPRWLLQSLRLHYSELLADNDELDPEWESTPLNYLEKIIQIPFTLRPMGEGGTTALVSSLLPVYEPTSAGDDPLPGEPGRRRAGRHGSAPVTDRAGTASAGSRSGPGSGPPRREPQPAHAAAHRGRAGLRRARRPRAEDAAVGQEARRTSTGSCGRGSTRSPASSTRSCAPATATCPTTRPC